jgi:hypothetical protein
MSFYIEYQYVIYNGTLAIVPSLSRQQITVVLPSDSNKFVDLVKESRSHLVNNDKNLSQTASTIKHISKLFVKFVEFA